ncbi:MAG: hypothetical protein GY863_07270, partial [bacterium]|nr:hypothetical protein [bacterium]
MLYRSNARVVLAAVGLLFSLMALLSCSTADQTVQSVVDLVSQTHYQKYQLDIENMGLGLYGG